LPRVGAARWTNHSAPETRGNPELLRATRGVNAVGDSEHNGVVGSNPAGRARFPLRDQTASELLAGRLSFQQSECRSFAGLVAANPLRGYARRDSRLGCASPISTPSIHHTLLDEVVAGDDAQFARLDEGADDRPSIQ